MTRRSRFVGLVARMTRCTRFVGLVARMTRRARIFGNRAHFIIGFRTDSDNFINSFFYHLIASGFFPAVFDDDGRFFFADFAFLHHLVGACIHGIVFDNFHFVRNLRLHLHFTGGLGAVFILRFGRFRSYDLGLKFTRFLVEAGCNCYLARRAVGNFLGFAGFQIRIMFKFFFKRNSFFLNNRFDADTNDSVFFCDNNGSL